MTSRQTGIEWTHTTWNPITGCTKVSAGCKNCYAERITQRFGRQKFADIVIHTDRMDAPRRWRKPRMIFVNSMSDLFHEQIPDHVITHVFATMEACRDRHIFQVLTKRANRMKEWVSEWEEKIDYMAGPGEYRRRYAHVWMGVSCEDQQNADRRIPELLATPCDVRFVSLEPLIGPIDLEPFLTWTDIDGCRVNLGPHWVIVGGESGPGHRPMKSEWVRQIQRQCAASRVPFFFKQWGGRTPKAGGRVLDGKTWDEMPGRGKVL